MILSLSYSSCPEPRPVESRHRKPVTHRRRDPFPPDLRDVLTDIIGLGDAPQLKRRR
jgi:hypothetical protein